MKCKEYQDREDASQELYVTSRLASYIFRITEYYDISSHSIIGFQKLSDGILFYNLDDQFNTLIHSLNTGKLCLSVMIMAAGSEVWTGETHKG